MNPMSTDTSNSPLTGVRARIETTAGAMTFEFFTDKAPGHVENFVKLAEKGFYDGTLWHRVVPGFVVQGGDPQGTGQGGPGYQFADELPKAGRYEIGSVAMANAGPNTNGSQFFLISGQSGVRLPPQYALFGKIVKGLDVLEAMQSVDTDRSDRPKDDVVIQSVTITESD